MADKEPRSAGGGEEEEGGGRGGFLINADCQGASLMYFSFKESVSNALVFSLFRGWGGGFFFFFLALCSPARSS